jgi:predicted nucleic acid-binding protein
MRVLVDTSVWSAALRRGKPSNPGLVAALKSLVLDRRVVLIGPIRQELLSGIRDADQFDVLKRHLDAFPDLELDADDYVTAARFFNRCRSKGIQGSNTDFLICAIAARHSLAIFTTDKDFDHYSHCLPITRHSY